MAPYQRTEQFLNRQKEIAQVEQALDQLPQLKPPALRGLVYSGLRGIGKSRLLQHVRDRCRQKELFSIWIDFEQQGVRSHLEYLLHLSDQFQPRRAGPRFREALLGATDATLDSIKRAEQALPLFAAGTKRRLKNQPLVLLMDGCEFCAPDFFDWIGQQFLTHLLEVRVGPMVVFLACRGQQVAESSWPVEMIRSTEGTHVSAFDFKTTKQLIRAVDASSCCRGHEKEIHTLSAGHPFSTEAVVAFLQNLNVKVGDFPQHREQLARRLYDEVICRYLCAGVKNWGREIFDIACIPRRFDPILLEKIAPEHSRHRYAAGLRDMQNSNIGLVEVDYGWPAYRLENTLRRLLHTAVSILDPALALALNQKLKTFYEEKLAQDTSTSRPTAETLLELLYHHAQIELLSNRPLLASTTDLFKEKLHAHFFPKETDEAMQLGELRDLLLHKDMELREIFGKTLIHQLAKSIDRFAASQATPQQIDLVIRHTQPSEYHVGCHAGSQTLIPTQTIHSQVRFSISRWRAKPEEIGKTAFRAYLTTGAQEFIKKNKKHNVFLTTDTMDIPFELLHDGKDFLCLQRPFSRRLEVNATVQNVEAPNSATRRALVIGNPSGDLKEAEVEAEAIADLMKTFGFEVDRFIGAHSENLSNVVTSLANQNYHLIHFAGHGFFNKENPGLSGLAFDKKTLLSADELKRFLRGPSFVFLNACWAAAAEPEATRVNYQGKFIQNLAIAALEGGASGCLGPMWEIEDKAAKDFALAFYTHLLTGQPIGEAVMRARKKVRRRATDCWASWVLFGEVGKRVV